jgi:hypothetical protein
MATSIVFVEINGAHVGDAAGRRWRITPTVIGWRLEFRDRGDTEPTYAGSHPTLEAAKAEASR